MSCTQAGVLEPAEDVLGGHSPQRLAQGLVEFGLRPRLGPAEPLLDLREHLLDRGVVRAVRRQRQHPRPARSIAAATPAARWGLRLSNTTTSPACNAGTSTCSTYVWNAAVSVAPGNASGARTPSRPNAAITVTDSHEAGAEPTARSPRGAQA